MNPARKGNVGDWIPIAEQRPYPDWPMLVKGPNSCGETVYAVVEYFKQSQQGYPGFHSLTCDCENGAHPSGKDIVDMDITPTHWKAIT